MRPKLTYANVMVTVLAFIVLGGGAYAASQLPKNSVGSKQLKRNAVTAEKIKNGAVSAAKIENGAVDGSKLGPSAFDGVVKSPELQGFIKAPVGPDQLGTIPAAGLDEAVYNVGHPGGIDCRGTAAKVPKGVVDDLVFTRVVFDTASLVHTEPGAVQNCWNGFQVQRSGTYLVNTWIGWDLYGAGNRQVLIYAHQPSEGEGCCQLLGVDETEASNVGMTTQTVAAVARLEQGATVFVQGWNGSDKALALTGGGLQIAWLGN
jgi:hypothetical protein